jgi:predicted amidohydrolase
MGQMLVEPNALESNLIRAESMIADAAARGASAIVLPETLDLGWTDSAAFTMAQPLPGASSALLSAAAARHGIVVAAGLTERAGDRVYNSAVLIDADGEIALIHRKIAELDFAREIYSTGRSCGVADTAIGRVGLAICADLWSPELGLAQGAMGAAILLSPCAWAVPPEFDNAATPYGKEWIASYSAIAEAHAIPVVGASNVGPLSSGAWAGYSCIGASLAVDSDGTIAARGAFGPGAEQLVIAELTGRG